MPAKLEFNKKDVDVSAKKYEVARTAGQATEVVAPGDTITFTRCGKDDTMGFSLAFVGDNAPGPVAAQQGKTSHAVTAPQTNKPLAWKYTVAFPNDVSNGDDVKEYDPIIIINPGLSTFSMSLTYLATFVGGAIVAYLAMRFLPGMLG